MSWHVFGNSDQQSFSCESSKSLPHCHRPVSERGAGEACGHNETKYDQQSLTDLQAANWSRAEQALDSWPSFASRGLVVSSLNVARTVLKVCGVVVGFRLHFRCWRVRGFYQKDPRALRHCSHIRRMSLEDHFGRHERLVQTQVSVCEVTTDRTARRQRAQASSAPFGMFVRSGTQEKRTSFRSGDSRVRVVR